TNGTGTSASPFNTLAPLTGASDPDGTGDIIYVFSGSGAYSSGITLETSQQLLGQGIALAVSDGVTTHNLVAAGTRPTLTNGSGNVITLGSGNTVKGLTVGNRSGSGLSGSSFGTLTVESVDITGSGQALSLTT